MMRGAFVNTAQKKLQCTDIRQYTAARKKTAKKFECLTSYP